MKCSDIKELLSAYANDELSRTQKEFIEEHLANCLDCRATLADYRVVRQQLTSLTEQTIPVEPNSIEDTIEKIQKIRLPRKTLNNTFSHFGEKKVLTFWSRIMPKTRLAWLLIPLILLLFGGAVYGAITVVKGLFAQYAPHIEKAGLAQELDLTQTIDGITVSLERAYADTNVVLVGYSVRGPEEINSALTAELSVNGTVLPGMMGIGVVPGSDMIFGNWRDSERAAMIMTYDASAIEGEPQELNLQLKLDVNKYVDPELALKQDSNSAGPFIFNFTTPFHKGKKLVLNKTVENSGISVTLNKIIISPWGTRVEFQIPTLTNEKSNYVNVTTNEITIVFPSDTDLGNVPGNSKRPAISFGFAPIGSLTVPDGNSYTPTFSKPSTFDNGTTIGYFEGDFTGQSGTLVFEINELVSPIMNIQITKNEDGYNSGIGEQKRISGPWIFEFEVP